LIFLLVNLVAQFKAGGVILRQACGGLRETAVYQSVEQGTADALRGAGIWSADAGEADSFYGRDYPAYIFGVLVFALTVVAYTTYGGFWAVTWTDVLQGIVILVGAMLL